MTVPVLNAKIAQANPPRLQTAMVDVTSPQTLTTQTQVWQGERWVYDVTLSATQGAEGRALSAFFNSLGRYGNKFLFVDPSVDQAIGGTPLVCGAGQTGNSLQIDGVPAGQVFREGDAFSLGSGESTRFYQITAGSIANGSGQATITFVPALRSSPADNAPLEVVAPKVYLKFDGPVPSTLEPAMIYRYSFSAYEAI